MADVFNKEPISFIDQNEQFPVLNEKVGLTYQQFKTLIENTNYLYNNLGLSSIEVGTVTTQFPSAGSFSDVIVEHNIEYVNNKPIDTLDFLFKIPTPRISASLTTEIVDGDTPTGMTLLTAPIVEKINGADVTTGYEFEFRAKLPKVPEYYVQYVEQELTIEQQEQARKNIGAGTSSFDGKYSSLTGTPSLSAVALSGEYADLLNRPKLSTVATSGLYNDLLNKPSAVLYTNQDLSSAQKSQARKNIGAGTSSFDGDYNSLSNRPTNISEFYNDVGYLTNATLNFVSYAETQNLTNTQKQLARNNIGAGTSNFDGKYSSLVGRPTALSAFKNDVGYITNASFDNYYTKNETDNLISSITVDLSDYYTKSETDAKINNLPTVAKTGSYNDLLNKPINLSEFTNDTGFITNAVNNLLNYYTKEEISNMFSGNVSFRFVTELPETGVENTVYFVSNASGTAGNLFDEYVWTTNATWEQLGSVNVDLSDYYTKAEVDGLLPDMTNYYTKDDLSGRVIPETQYSNYYKFRDDGLYIGKYSGYTHIHNDGAYMIVQSYDRDITFYAGSSCYLDVSDNSDNTKGLKRLVLHPDELFFQKRNNYYVGSIMRAEDDSGMVYRGLTNNSNTYNLKWNFNDVQIQISGNDLVTALTGTNTLNIGKVYTCTSDSDSGEYKSGHIYLIGGTSGAYTTTDITPLSESNIETISLNGVELPITNKNVDISIPTQLSGFSNDVGYITLKDIPDVDLSNYYTKDETNNLVDTATYVSYNTVQSLTDVQKARARQNIDATNFSGEYNDLLNKPTFATVAISGNYADLLNKPVIDTTIANSTNAVQNKAIYNRFASVDNDISSATTTANNAYSTAQSASSTANGINTKLNSLTLVDNGNNSYTLKFTQDNVIVGTITLPNDKYIKSISQSTIYNNVVFTWNEASTEYPNGTFTLDLKPYVYTAGNGISTAKISDTDNRNKISVYLDSTDENNKLFFNNTTGGLNVDLSDYAKSADLAKVATSGNYSDLSGTPTLSTVATTGSYNDLIDKPTYDSDFSDTSTNAIQNKVITEWKNTLYEDYVSKNGVSGDDLYKLYIRRNSTSITDQSYVDFSMVANNADVGNSYANINVFSSDLTNISSFHILNNSIEFGLDSDNGLNTDASIVLNRNQETGKHISFYQDGTLTYLGDLALKTELPTITLNNSTVSNPSFYAPTSAGTSGFFLKSNGSGEPVWAEIPDNTISIDNALSTTSTNPVQNAVITNALINKQNTLSAGNGITINDNNTISFNGLTTGYGTYTGSANGTSKSVEITIPSTAIITSVICSHTAGSQYSNQSMWYANSYTTNIVLSSNKVTVNLARAQNDGTPSFKVFVYYITIN